MNREQILNLSGFDNEHILFGILFTFGNLLQAAGDSFYEEITSKQFFLLICLSLFKDNPPTLNELAQVMQSSHQNVKQLAAKLEKNGFVTLMQDQKDRRKMRIMPAEKLAELSSKYRDSEDVFMRTLYDGLTAQEIAEALNVMLKMEQNLLSIREESE